MSPPASVAAIAARLDRVADASVRGSGRRGRARDPRAAGRAGRPDRACRADLQRRGAAGPRDGLDRGRRRPSPRSRRCPTRRGRSRRPPPRRPSGPSRHRPARSSTSASPARPGPDRVVSAMQAFKGVLRERPGAHAGRRPRPGTGRGRAADGAPGRRLRRRARGRGPPADRRRDHRPPARVAASSAVRESARRHGGVICAPWNRYGSAMSTWGSDASWESVEGAGGAVPFLVALPRRASEPAAAALVHGRAGIGARSSCHVAPSALPGERNRPVHER